ADVSLLAVIAVGDVIADGHVRIAQGDAVAGLAVGAHGAGGAIRVAVGHRVGDHARGLRAVLHRAALAVDPLDDLAADVAAVDLAAGEAAAHRAGDRRQLAAVAAADLVADQATNDRAGHGPADVAVALGHALLHHHVVADLARAAAGGGFTDGLGADHRGVLRLPLGHRLDGEHAGIFEAAVGRDRSVVAEARDAFAPGIDQARGRCDVGARRVVLVALERGDGDAADQQRGKCNGKRVVFHIGLLGGESAGCRGYGHGMDLA